MMGAMTDAMTGAMTGAITGASNLWGMLTIEDLDAVVVLPIRCHGVNTTSKLILCMAG